MGRTAPIACRSSAHYGGCSRRPASPGCRRSTSIHPITSRGASFRRGVAQCWSTRGGSRPGLACVGAWRGWGYTHCCTARICSSLTHVNPKLSQLLAACSVEGDLVGPIRWSEAVILQNYGAIPPAVGKRGFYVWNRGFNLLLLGRGGVPLYFCKCRPAADHNLGRETAVLKALNRDLELSSVAPWTRGARSGELQLQVSEFVPGDPYALDVPGLGERQWAASMRDILTVARRVSIRAAALLPDFLAGTDPVVLHEVAAPSLAELGSAGLGEDQLRALDAAIRRAGTLPRLLQHGDLWPPNILWHQGSWRLLDFESFGRVQVPLYDVHHFVRTCWSLRRRRFEATTGGWLDHLASRDREAALC